MFQTFFYKKNFQQYFKISVYIFTWKFENSHSIRNIFFTNISKKFYVKIHISFKIDFDRIHFTNFYLRFFTVNKKDFTRNKNSLQFEKWFIDIFAIIENVTGRKLRRQNNSFSFDDDIFFCKFIKSRFFFRLVA